MISPIERCESVRGYLNRIGAKMRTLFTAAITVEAMGYQKDVYLIRFSREGAVRSPDHLSPTVQEAEAMAADIRSCEFPFQQTVSALSNSNLPPMIKAAKDKDLFIFRDRSRQIVFIQVRIDLDNGDKRYVPHTYWSDGEWRNIEPENGLPIYGLEEVVKGDRVFLHEGAKAAKAAQEIASSDAHPWSSYFSTGKHIGWIGGAHFVNKTIWRELLPLPGELIIVPDNDFIGRAQVSKIAEKFDCPVSYSMLDNCWPKGWDVADPIPESMYPNPEALSDGEVVGLYSGPQFEDTLIPCDWATVDVSNDDKPKFAIREEFAQNWVRIQQIRGYAHIGNPETVLDREQFNVKVRPYSDVADTASLMSKMNGNICDKVTFMPSHPSGLVRIDGELCLNQYVDRRLRPSRGGSTAPFWEFMEYLFPIEKERYVVKRWAATLYARPDIRMGYAMLFLSKLQGVGKSTLLNILAEMVGRRHVSFPGDAMIQGDFNGWIVNKRFVVVHEIYAGQNWKAYNRLKTLVTDEYIEANNKHIANYTVPNWTHYGAASNSLEALRMEHDDRRWFVPKLPEYLYDDYPGLRRWIAGGGLRYLAQEFLGFNDYVSPGETAPRTAAKDALIDQSMPMDERLVLSLCERMRPDDCLDVGDVWLWLQTQARAKAYATPQRIMSLLSDAGFAVSKPIKVGARNRTIIWGSQSLRDSLRDLDEKSFAKAVAEKLSVPDRVFSDDSSM